MIQHVFNVYKIYWYSIKNDDILTVTWLHSKQQEANKERVNDNKNDLLN